MSRSPLILLLLLLTVPTAASAKQTIDLKPADPGIFLFETTGEYRLNFSFLDDFAVDAEDPALTHGQTKYLDQRIRARVDLQLARLRLATEWDLLSGQLAGDAWNLGSLDDRRRDIHGAVSPSGFVPRRASAMLRWKALDIELGLVTSNWGLGLIANDGNQDSMFGRNDLGDRVLRLRFTGRPLHANAEPGPYANKFLLTAAFDVVFDDDVGSLMDGQLAMQGIVSAFLYDPGHCNHGLYVVYRNQQEPNDTGSTDVVVIDGYADRTLHIGETTTLRLALEGAFIVGRTSRALTYQAPDELRVASGGLVAQATVGLFDKKLQIHGRGGIASGDKNPDDHWSTQFNFDRNFDNGSVLFDQVLGAVNLGTHGLVTDPENSGYAPRGVDALANEGAAGGIFFLQPIVQGTPLPFLDLKAGAMLAFSSSEHRQSFYSFRAGGTPTNHHQQAVTGRLLGTEIDWSVTFGGPLPFKAEDAPVLDLALQVQGGHLFLGEALRSADDGAQIVNHVQMTGRFRW
ncbi:MAG: hypothetical protein GY898_01405 [Proteobacteria bacterium]|nr:hypothetical protein [Pseudomonadota bacterium]